MCELLVHEYIQARSCPHKKDGSIQCTDRPAKSPAFAGIVVHEAEFTYTKLGPGFCFSNLLVHRFAESPDAHQLPDFFELMIVLNLCLRCNQFEGGQGSKEKELQTTDR